MDFDNFFPPAIFILIVLLLGGMIWGHLHEMKTKTEAIERLVQQGTPALEAAYAIKGK